MTCAALYCHNRASKKVEGITFHCFPKNEKRREAWLEAVNRKDWLPSNSSTLCSQHFEAHMFYRMPTMPRVYLNPDAVPTIFPAKQRDKMKFYEKSKKQPKDPSKVPQAPGVGKRKRGRPPKRTKKVTRCASSVAQEPKELDKQTDVKPILPETPAVDENQDFWQEPSQDIVKTALQTEMDEDISDGSEVVENQENLTRDITKTALQTAIVKNECDRSTDVENWDSREETAGGTTNTPFQNDDSEEGLQKNSSKGQDAPKDPAAAVGAGKNVLLVNLVCPHCQKACRVCLGVQPQPPAAPPASRKGRIGSEWQTVVQLRKANQKVQRLMGQNHVMQKRVKALQQEVRRLMKRNARLQDTMVSMIEDNEEEMVVIGSVNGVLNDA